jgi:hypothetical protein
MLKVAKRVWIPLVILLVVFVAAFTVDRFRGFFGHAVPTKPGAGTLTTTAPAASLNIIAQSDGDTITCRSTVDGVVKDERTSDGVNAKTFCLMKSA